MATDADANDGVGEVASIEDPIFWGSVSFGCDILDFGGEGGVKDGGPGVGMMTIWDLGGLRRCDGWIDGS